MTSRFLIDEVTKLIPLVFQFQHATDFTLAKHFKENHKLGAKDRSYISDAIYTLIRNKSFLEWLANLAPAHETSPQYQRLAVLTDGLRTLDTSESPSEQLPSLDLALRIIAACTGSLAQESHAPWLKASMDTLATKNELPDAARHNLPAWLALELQKQYGIEPFWQLVAALRQNAPLDLRVNILKTKRAAVLDALTAQAVTAHATALSPWGLRVEGKPSLQKVTAYQQGLVEVQDEGSQLLCLLTDAKRNETVIDFCAGAGGKTLALGAMMRNTGRLYAFDNSASRLESLKPRLQRSGLSNVHTMVIENEQDARLQRLWGKADRVLVDSPCSGLGTLRRSPDLAWRLKPKDISALQDLQKSILCAAAKHVKPGGFLIYATCSLLQQENADVANWWQQESQEWQSVDIQTTLAKHSIKLDKDCIAANQLALLPHQNATDGFFCAVWKKVQ